MWTTAYDVQHAMLYNSFTGRHFVVMMSYNIKVHNIYICSSIYAIAAL